MKAGQYKNRGPEGGTRRLSTHCIFIFSCNRLAENQYKIPLHKMDKKHSLLCNKCKKESGTFIQYTASGNVQLSQSFGLMWHASWAQSSKYLLIRTLGSFYLAYPQKILL